MSADEVPGEFFPEEILRGKKDAKEFRQNSFAFFIINITADTPKSDCQGIAP